MNILFVCTGNLCRSPFAEAMLRQRLVENHHVEGHVTVRSVGLLREDVSVPEEVLLCGTRFGLDLSEHRSRRMEASHLGWADLVIGMAREHVREAVVISQAAWPRSFTFRELVRRGNTVGPRRAGEDLASWLARVHAGRRAADLVGMDVQDDVEDPLGGPPEGYQAMGQDIAALLDSMIGLVWGEPTNPSDPSLSRPTGTELADQEEPPGNPDGRVDSLVQLGPQAARERPSEAPLSERPGPGQHGHNTSLDSQDEQAPDLWERTRNARQDKK